MFEINYIVLKFSKLLIYLFEIGANDGLSPYPRALFFREFTHRYHKGIGMANSNT